MRWSVFCFFFFTQHVITCILSTAPLYCMIDQINKLPEDGLKSSPNTSHYIENTWISQKIKIKLYFSYTLLKHKQILCAKCKVWAYKRCSKISNRDYHLKRNDTKYFCQSHTSNIVLPSSNKWLSKSNSKTIDDALDNTIIIPNNNKNDF